MRRASIGAGGLALVLVTFGHAGCLLSRLDGLQWQGPADAGPGDAGVADSGVADSGVADAGVADAGVADAGVADAGVADAGSADAGSADAGVADAGVADAGSADAGSADAGSADAGSADAGVADAGPVCPPHALPDTCDLAYLSDGENCCVAGRSCQGGTCHDGRCDPVKIADTAGEGGPCPDLCVNPALRGIAVDSQYVLWTDGFNHLLNRCAKDGKSPMTISIQIEAVGLVLRGPRAYFLGWNDDALHAVSLGGGGDSTIVAHTTFAAAHSLWGRLAMDDTRACWAMQGEGTQPSPPGVWCAILPSSGVATAVPLALGSVAGSDVQETVVSPYGMAMDSQYVYWSDYENGESGVVKRRRLDSLMANVLAEVVASGQSYPADLALDAERVYWLGRDGLLWRPKDLSAESSILAQSTGEIENRGRGNLVVDDSYVYWTDYRAGTVNRVRKDRPLETEVLATSQVYPWGIAQDCETVYWATDAGPIMKVAK